MKQHPTILVALILLLLGLLFLAGSASAQNQMPAVSVQPYCDGDTTYFSVLWVRTNGTGTILATLDQDMQPYTPSGDQVPGACNATQDTATAPLYYFTTAASGTLPDGLESYMILNAGSASATLTYAAGSTVIGGVSIPGGAQTLEAGQWVTCAANVDSSGRRRTCGGVAYNGTGTTLAIYLKPE